jgi:hypothetical protein
MISTNISALLTHGLVFSCGLVRPVPPPSVISAHTDVPVRDKGPWIGGPASPPEAATPTREITGGYIGISNIPDRSDTMRNKVRHDARYTRPFSDPVRIGNPSR